MLHASREPSDISSKVSLEDEDALSFTSNEGAVEEWMVDDNSYGDGILATVQRQQHDGEETNTSFQTDLGQDCTARRGI